MSIVGWWKGKQVGQFGIKPERHWSSKLAHAVWDFARRNYQWLVLVVIGLVGLYLAIK